ncbi:MAG TPA: acyltransferase family protein [Sphingomonas sp.]|uniref:acyltransferase family protein n=1 Tax=Sphingomonas sp. TaxID=28214 RepID=UPI002EDB4B25
MTDGIRAEDRSRTRSAPADAAHRYRPEIDGLRAVAVLPVVLFHAGVGTLSGGFVGVDIFFVISGFLITGILFREMTERRFSILRFYERRLRRIVPNLIAALTATTVVALAILIPVDLKLYAYSVIATLGFAANIFFWLKIGYFTPSAEQFPLLHMWSLGVEEQYYLLFPLLMMVVVRRDGWLKPLLWGLVALSLGTSLYQVATAPDAAFYLPFARLWELMAGSLLAIGAVPAIRSESVRDGVGWAGLAAIGIAVLAYGADTPFPGASALLPCLGAAAIVHATGSGPSGVGRLLATRPLVFVGSISYSLYIWHWPLIVFTRYALQRPLTPIEIAMLLAVTLTVAIAAWKWIEQPWRQRSVSLRRLLTFTGVGAAGLAAVAAALIVARGWPDRYPAAIRVVAMAPFDINPRRAACDSPSIARLAAGDVCRIGTAGVAPSFALVGDSFGDAWAPGVDAAAAEAGVSGLSLTQSGCAPLMGVNEPGSSCRARVEAMYALIRRTPSIRHILIVGRWPAMVEGRRFGLLGAKPIRLIDDVDAVGASDGNDAVVARGFVRSIAAVAPARMIAVTGLPEQAVNVPQAATVRMLFGGDLSGIARPVYALRQARTARLLNDVAAHHPLRIIDAGAVLCNAGHCPILADGRALYVDDNHVSRFGAIAHRRLFMDAFGTARHPAGTIDREARP